MVYAQPEVPTQSGRWEALDAGVAALIESIAAGASFFPLLTGLIAMETISHAFASRRCLLGDAGFALCARGCCFLLWLAGHRSALRRRFGFRSHARLQLLQRLHRRHLLFQF